MSTEKIEKFLSIGSRIREERKRLEITQENFALLASISVQSQRSYEAGRSTPDAVYLGAIAAAGADVTYILTGVRSCPNTQPLTREEECLLDNYRHSTEAEKAAMQATLDAFSQSKQVTKRRTSMK